MKLSEEQCNMKSPVTWTEFRATLPFSRNGHRGGFPPGFYKSSAYPDMIFVKSFTQADFLTPRNLPPKNA